VYVWFIDEVTVPLVGADVVNHLSVEEEPGIGFVTVHELDSSTQRALADPGAVTEPVEPNCVLLILGGEYPDPPPLTE
jgi:hypothetical protein